MPSSTPPTSIGFSRTLGLLDALAIGLSIAWSLAAFVVTDEVLAFLGPESPLVFFVGAGFFVIVSLSLLALASATPGDAGLYDLARPRRGGSTSLAFSAAWLILGGYLSVGLLLAGGIGERVAAILRHFFGISIEVTWLIAAAIVLTGVYTLMSSLGWTRGKTFAVIAGLVLPICVLTLGFWLIPASDPDGVVQLSPLKHWLIPVALLASALWGVDALLLERSRLRRPNRTSIAAVSIIWIFVFVLCTALSVMILTRPHLNLMNWDSQLTRTENRLEVLSLVCGIIVCWVGLHRISVSALALSGAMARDGFLPQSLTAREDEGSPSPLAKMLVHGLLGAALLAHLGTLPTIAMAAISFLIVTILLLTPETLRKAKELPSRRRIRFPMHPLMPGVAVAGAALLALLLLKDALLVLAGWAVVGLVVWLAYGRKGRLKGLSLRLVLTDSELPASKAGFRVLVAAGAEEPTKHRIRAAKALARAKDGEVMVVRVVPMGDPMSVEESRAAAKRELAALTHLVADAARPASRPDTEEAPTVEPIPLVRIAPSVAAGVLAAASEFNANLILIGWPETSADQDREEENIAEHVFTSTGRPVAILRGEPGAETDKIVVAASGGPHASLALTLGTALAEAFGLETELLNIRPKGRPVAESEALLAQTLERSATDTRVDLVSRESAAPHLDLLQAGGPHGVLFLGASVDRILRQTHFGGLATEVAEARTQPTVVVKRSERITRYWLRRAWEMLSHPVPTVSVQDRTQVFVQMRHGARAHADFYMLTLLASTIAILGLLLDSGAVIIGAMLVAPLMSPILAMAHGVVHGNEYMLRRATVSTFKGAALAVGVSTFITLILPSVSPTTQILARTQPNLLDLGVALAAGAAGAYAMARKSVAAAVPGVAISVALVPPLCVVGYGLGSSSFLIAGGALLLFLTNLGGIVLIGALIFLLMGFRPSRAARDDQVRKAMAMVIVIILLLAVPLGLQTRRQLEQYHITNEIEAVFRQDLVRQKAQVTDLRIRRVGGSYLVEATLYVFRDVDVGGLEALKAHLIEEVGLPVEIEATVLRAATWSTREEARGQD